MTNIFSNINYVLDEYYQKRAKLFEKLIGERVIDSLLHMPSYTIEKVYSHPISEKDLDKIVTTKIRLDCIELSPGHSKRPSKVYGKSGEEPVEILLFNNKAVYVKKMYLPGKELLISGKLTLSSSHTFQFVNPERIGSSQNINSFVGFFNIYPLTTGLTQDSIYHVIKNSLNILKKEVIDEWLPNEILEKYNWPHLYEAFESIHKPKENIAVPFENKSRQRISFDEILAEQIAIRFSNYRNTKGVIIKNEKKLIAKLLSMLPFKLTESQSCALSDILNDMESGNVMTRLLQGDVGSGKTIVSLLVALNAIESGYQCSILAPTEILARQHFSTISKYLEPLGIQVELLTSNEKGKKRTEILRNVSTGISKILVGTHAIITDHVTFANLGLVIIDEQHRFGVNQRLQLIEKGQNPHILSMTATPIPRTMILSLYGDISVSSITEKPVGRKEIVTKAIPLSKINDVINSIGNIISRGQKIYWVCPLIEESEKTDYTCVINRLSFLKNHFGDNAEMLHGKMKAIEKQEIFKRFKEGEFKILVSTTVIEVGVDVPDATVIIIENAEKFGLSQLHQLRGRVGRSDLQSYCLLLYDNKLSEIAAERIKILKESNDGFYVSEKDLLLRGGGEIFGTRQSGAKKYKTFDFNNENNHAIFYDLLKQAAALAAEIVKKQEIDKYEILLKIFSPENFQIIKKSF